MKICDNYCERVTVGEMKSNKELYLCSVMHSSRAKSDEQYGYGIWTNYASDVNAGKLREINPVCSCRAKDDPG